jgi:hypothetical protein
MCSEWSNAVKDKDRNRGGCHHTRYNATPQKPATSLMACKTNTMDNNEYAL